MMNFWEVFNDPIFRGPFWGSVFMSIASSLIGCIAIVRKKALFGESVSHSAYPGVIIGLFVSVFCGGGSEASLMLNILIFGSLFALTGFYLIEKLTEKYKISSDASQCYILASFFGLGLTLASIIQKSHGQLYKKIQALLYGQAATMGDFHILSYGLFAFVVLGFILLFFPYLKAYLFDVSFCDGMGLNSFVLKAGLILLFSFSVVLGMKSAGTILMCGILVAPAICALQLAHRFSSMLIIAATVGGLSAAIGVFLSMIIPEVTSLNSFPTGPAIVLVASCFCFLAFLMSPKKGLVVCCFRKFCFKRRCIKEHILKIMWKRSEISFAREDLVDLKIASKIMTSFCLYGLYRNGWVQKDVLNSYQLTKDGKKKAAYIIRLHRLWELYLSEHLGFLDHQIHKSAEEMEHIISPEIEKKLTRLLLDPKKDPHDQPIPQKEWLL